MVLFLLNKIHKIGNLFHQTEIRSQGPMQISTGLKTTEIRNQSKKLLFKKKNSISSQLFLQNDTGVF